MSLLVNIYTFHGIVIAADKRITKTNKTESGIESFVLTDNDRKLFLAKNGFAVSFCGDASPAGIPTGAHIETFLSQHESFDSTADLSKSLAAYLKSFDPACETGILVSGFDNSKYSISELHTATGVLKEHISPDSAGIVRYGEDRVIRKLLEIGNVDWCRLSLQDAIDLAGFLIKTTSTWLSFLPELCTVSPVYDMAIITPEETRWITSHEYHA